MIYIGSKTKLDKIIGPVIKPMFYVFICSPYDSPLLNIVTFLATRSITVSWRSLSSNLEDTFPLLLLSLTTLITNFCVACAAFPLICCIHSYDLNALVEFVKTSICIYPGVPLLLGESPAFSSMTQWMVENGAICTPISWRMMSMTVGRPFFFTFLRSKDFLLAFVPLSFF